MAPERGSITLVALCMTTALGIALGSYVALCTRSTQLSTRQLQREKTGELAQVGLEEALWALNQNNWTSSGPDGNASWTTSGANRTVTLAYPMDGQGVTGSVTLTVANYASTGPTWPTITSAATLTLPSGETATKTQQATTQPAPLFGNAIASSESYVSFVAGGTIDSWNSDPDNNSATPAVAFSFTAGNATNYDAVIAGNTNSSNYGVVLTQATLYGYAATFGKPVSYSTSGSPPGKVLGPSTAAGANVDTTRIGKSAFVPLDDVFTVTLPDASGANATLISSILDLVAKLLALPVNVDVYKVNSSLTVNGTALIGPNITITHPTKMIVVGDLTITTGLLGAKGKITVQPGASLELYVTGDVSIGADAFDNQTNEPKNLAIFCTDTSAANALVYNSAKPFCGVIFCEHKPIDIQQNATFSGALLSRSYVRFSGSATAPVFHYDVALRQARFAAVGTPYLIKEVTEP